MSWAERTGGIEVGDRVAYKASFLRDTGRMTGDVPFALGVVESIKDYGNMRLANVDWGRGNEEVPCKVNVKNLSRVTERGIMD